MIDYWNINNNERSSGNFAKKNELIEELKKQLEKMHPQQGVEKKDYNKQFEIGKKR